MSTLKEIGPIVVAGFVAFGLAVWFSIVVWTFMDIRSRSRDKLVWAFATLLVLLFNVFGLIVYLILRPHETLMQAYERSLEEEALLQEIEERPICPNCRHRVEPTFRICPNCLQKLKDVCASCDKLVELDWPVCPYCTTERKPSVALADQPTQLQVVTPASEDEQEVIPEVAEAQGASKPATSSGASASAGR